MERKYRLQELHGQQISVMSEMQMVMVTHSARSEENEGIWLWNCLKWMATKRMFSSNEYNVVDYLNGSKIDHHFTN